MNALKVAAGMAGLFALGACTVMPPTAPSVAAMPPSGKPFDQFQSEDAACRNLAYNQVAGSGQAQAASNNAVGSAVVGTALGAAAGAAIGSVGGAVGGGAAVGGALGLLAGSAAGANGAQASAYGMQRQFDLTYSQCMFAKGNTIQQPQPSYPGYGYPGYGYYPNRYNSPYPYYYAPY